MATRRQIAEKPLRAATAQSSASYSGSRQRSQQERNNEEQPDNSITSKMTDAMTKSSRGSGLGRVSSWVKRLLVRGAYSLVETLGVMFSTAGLVRTLGIESVALVAFHGLQHLLVLGVLSGISAFALTYAHVFYKTKVDMKDAANLMSYVPSSDSSGSSSWKMLTELATAYQKTFDAFPELQLDRLSTMRDQAFEELMLRFMSLITKHTTDRVCPICNDEDVDAPEAASDDMVEDLRKWLPYAEAPYYDMMSETAIQEWLSERGYQLILAKPASEQNAPVHCVGVNREEKELLVLIRGTVDIADAVTDMTVTPEEWGDNDHKVHRGIGLSAHHLYERLSDVCCMFDQAGYHIVIVGHSLGAGAAALLAWLLKRDGLDNVRAIAYATPACASLTIADECRDYVISCVMRDDLIPRFAPRSMLRLEQTLLAVDWDTMDECAKEWGPFGGWLHRIAKGKAKDRGGDVVECNDDGESSDAGQKLLDDRGAIKDAASVERMIPVVPGKIVYLHPTNHRAVDDVVSPEEAAARAKASKGDAGEGENAEDDKDAEEDDQGGAPAVQIEQMKFKRSVIDAAHPTLTTIRLVAQGVQDHLLDAYRLGLGMPGKAEDHPEENLEAAA